MVKNTMVESPVGKGNIKGRQQRFSRLLSLGSLAVLTLGIALGSLFWGAYALSAADIFRYAAVGLGWSDAELPTSIRYMLFHLRLPRIIMALLTGALLAGAGAALQALFRNPLADPGLTGVSSGAMVFTVGGLVFLPLLPTLSDGLSHFMLLTGFGFLGGLLSTALVYRLSTFGGKTYVATMLLAGVAVGALAGAITGLFTYFSSESQLRDITFWTLGSLGSATWPTVAVLFPITGILLFLLFRQSPALNLLLLGEQEAAFSGVNVQQVKRMIIVCTALGVGACVAACGMIGFIGLVVPHLLRLLGGADYRWLLPGSALLGGAVLVAADTVARTAIAPAELPIGILTAFIGSPFFLWLLLKNRGRAAMSF